MRLAAALALLLALSAPAFAADDSDPVALITSIYKTYTANEHDEPDQAGEEDVYSKGLQALFDKDAAETPEGDEGRLDFDPFVDGQDWALSGLKISEVYRSGGEARVRAVFANFGEQRNIVFNLVREDGKWRIDEITETLAPRWTLSKILAGAPDAFPDEKAQ